MLKNNQFLLNLKGEVENEPLLKFQSWKSRGESKLLENTRNIYQNIKIPRDLFETRCGKRCM
jgi:hypothetical protein